MSASILNALGLSETNSGTYLGQGEWSKTTDAGVLEPINPTTGEVLGRVLASSQAAAAWSNRRPSSTCSRSEAQSSACPPTRSAQREFATTVSPFEVVITIPSAVDSSTASRTRSCKTSSTP